MTEQDLTNIFGRNIRFYRNINGWTQETLAEKIGVSKNTIWEIEMGRKFVRGARLVKFANLFNTSVYKLFVPNQISYDDSNTADILIKYSEEVKEAVENIRNTYFSKDK
jgi:transcriptional regulator with XRE-family HTH domain